MYSNAIFVNLLPRDLKFAKIISKGAKKALTNLKFVDRNAVAIGTLKDAEDIPYLLNIINRLTNLKKIKKNMRVLNLINNYIFNVYPYLENHYYFDLVRLFADTNFLYSSLKQPKTFKAYPVNNNGVISFRSKPIHYKGYTYSLGTSPVMTMNGYVSIKRNQFGYNYHKDYMDSDLNVYGGISYDNKFDNHRLIGFDTLWDNDFNAQDVLMGSEFHHYSSYNDAMHYLTYWTDRMVQHQCELVIDQLYAKKQIIHYHKVYNHLQKCD